MKAVLGLVIITVLSGCVSQRSYQMSTSDTTHTVHSEKDFSQEVESSTGDMAQATVTQQVIERLTLSQALELAEALHPDLKAGRASIDEARGRALQAGLFPNPEFGARAESIRFSDPGASEVEYLAGISQPIPLGRRLSAAREVELLELERLSLDLQSKYLEIRKRIQLAFADVLYWQELSRVWQNTVEVSQEAFEIAESRVQVGDTIPAEAGRAEMELRRARLELEKAQSNLVQVNKTLVTAIGNPSLEISSVETSLSNINFEAPPVDLLIARLDHNPYLASASAEVAVREARVHLAEEQRRPDLNLDFFYRRIGNEEDSADVGFSIPIPLFDRNQGMFQAAQAALVSSMEQARSLRNEFELEIHNSHKRLVLAIDTATLLREDILPQAQSVLETFEERYAEGDISMAEILPIRRDYTALQIDYLDALRDVLHRWVELLPYTSFDSGYNSGPEETR